jgi:hypothetical protein
MIEEAVNHFLARLAVVGIEFIMNCRVSCRALSDPSRLDLRKQVGKGITTISSQTLTIMGSVNPKIKRQEATMPSPIWPKTL